MNGLSEQEVSESRRAHGTNLLTPPQRTSLWKLYLDKYRDPIIQILLVAAAISLILAFIEKDFIETIGIFLAIFFATTVGFYFERDAARKFNVLNALGEEQPVKVRRNGKVTEIPRKDVVVGDVILMETGDEVPADGRLIVATNLQIDESSLTGEPICSKHILTNDPAGREHTDSTYPADMVLRSTMVMDGRGEAIVTAVGDATEIGKVARKSTETTGTKTPLNVQLEKLAALISKIGSAVAVAAFVIFLVHDILTADVWHSGDYFKMAGVVLNYFMMAVTLIVMAVPEGLPMAVTLSLALNMRRMLRSKILVRKLHACETMGAVTVICTDKTGTLTQNKMQVADVQIMSGAAEEESQGGKKRETDFLAQAIAANTTAELDGETGIGNPTEVALLLWMKHRGYDYRQLRTTAKTTDLLPFSTEWKYMAVTALIGGETFRLIKGAPEIILSQCEMEWEERDNAQEQLLRYQQKAMRTLAFAFRRGDEARQSFTLQAIAAISDPVRADVPDAVKQCQDAGIEVKIVTGDTSATAIEIARQIGIWGIHNSQFPIPNYPQTLINSSQFTIHNSHGPEEESLSMVHDSQRSGQDARSIGSNPDLPDADTIRWHITGAEFAALTDEEAYERVTDLRVMSRARPTDKQRLVELLQRHGEVVAVTGDGTNDAPALHYAHVGLSLGSGTSVAKEASDMTLINDSFASIANAVMWGRSLYKNIQRFLFFQLVVNLTALLLVLGGSVIGTEMPLTVTQILWVNLIMDTFAALALASLPPSHEVMHERPRRQTDFIINRSMARSICVCGALFFAFMLAFLIYCERRGQGGVDVHELTLFFTTFVMLQFWNLLNAKTLGSCHSAFRHFRLDGGLILVLVLILFGQWVIVTFGGKMFRTEPLSLTEWAAVILCTSVVLWAGEIRRLIVRCRK